MNFNIPDDIITGRIPVLLNQREQIAISLITSQ